MPATASPWGGLDKPERELRAFAKTELLQPSQAQTVSFTFEPTDLASYDPERSAWIAAPGTYTVKVGASSLDIRQQATFQLASERVVQKAHKVLTPQVHIDERKAPRM